MTEADVLIIGGGQAGFQLAISLRTIGFSGRIIILAQEAVPPYMRPPLSKGFMKDLTHEDDLPFRTAAALEDAGIELCLQTEVQSLDVEHKLVKTSDGRRFGFDTLVFATGTRARTLPDFTSLKNVCTLRTLDDAKRIKQALPEARHLTVLGGGFIGLEFAAVARQMGKDVMVIEAADRLLTRGLSPFMAEWFLQLHRKHEVDVQLATSIQTHAEADGCLTSITLSNGETIQTDLLVIGIGVVPNCEIAEAAGLRIENGIVVDEYLRTGGKGIYAIGDCAAFPQFSGGELIRLESVQNAVDQAKYVAGRICNPALTAPYQAVPWFWTEQFNVKLQMAGLQQGHDSYRVIGSADDPAFAVEYLIQGKCISVDSVNRPKTHIAARKQLADAD